MTLEVVFFKYFFWNIHCFVLLQKRTVCSTRYAILTSNRLSLGLDISELVCNHNANLLVPNKLHTIVVMMNFLDS